MPYCKNCGTQLTNDARYCYKCGTPTTPTTTATINQPQSGQPTITPINQQPNKQEKPTNKPAYKDPLFLLILCTLIITIIALIIIFTFLGTTNQNFFGPPGINRVSLNTPQLINNSYKLY